MTVANTPNIISYACDGAATEFDFTFPVPNGEADSVVKAKVVDSDDIETELTIITDYSISAPNGNYSSGGTVTTVTTYSSDYTLYIYRELPLQQETAFAAGSAVPAATLQAVVDRLAMLVQDMQQRIDDNVFSAMTPSTVRADLGLFTYPETVVYEGDVVTYEGEIVTYQ